jgi:hypothetical protein
MTTTEKTQNLGLFQGEGIECEDNSIDPIS